MGRSASVLQSLPYSLLLCIYQFWLFLTPGAFSLSPRSLDTASIDDLNKLQEAGIVSSVDLVKTYIRRTHEVNDHLHAVSEINPDAISIASRLDWERAAGYLRGPLHGVPILLKDNIATTDALNTTAGSYALLGARPKHEAVVARKLRDAGAVILGKVTMGEWAQFRSGGKTSSHGWSPLGGQALGAYYPQQDPHGSSSGSAVAVSVGLAAGTLATETSGSIVNPAERNNVVGIKPTLGLTSRDMVIPISLRQDSVGPIAQTVKDAAYILSAIAGKDPMDVWTLEQPWPKPPDYVKACKLSGLNGVRLGVPRNGIEPFLSQSSIPIMSAFESALQTMRYAGASIEDSADFSSFDIEQLNLNSQVVLAADFESGLVDYLSKLDTNPNKISSLNNLIHYTRNHPFEEADDRGVGSTINTLMLPANLSRYLHGNFKRSRTSAPTRSHPRLLIRQISTWLAFTVFLALLSDMILMPLSCRLLQLFSSRQ